MELDFLTIRRMFEDVLSGRITREQADRWAYSIMQKEEAGVLKYSPPGCRERIWAGVMYLYGVDTRKGPNEYLHTDDDVVTAMKVKLDGALQMEDAMPALISIAASRSG
jgi:hypothetical protein